MLAAPKAETVSATPATPATVAAPATKPRHLAARPARFRSKRVHVSKVK
jgi:hypothetical protein